MKNSSIGKSKVVIAFSGGVDSAVAGALLKKQGYDVVGVFFRFFDPTWKLSFQAKEIARKLAVPLKIVDARKEFRKKIIEYFISSYKKGETPNPCVVCNKEMKFRLLFELMKKEKADFVATGHYARLCRELKMQNTKRKNKENYIYKLIEAKDKSKDQSYFLYRLNQKDLSKIIFPLGEFEKKDIKNMAKKMKLPIEEKESQDICFMADDDVKRYLAENIKLKPGKIIDESGEAIGKHKGVALYTLGQRKGIEIGGTGPYWVSGKNIRKNELIVAKSQKNLLADKFLIKNANWISKKMKFPFSASVRIRYQAPKISAIIKKRGEEIFFVEAKKPLRAITPGQSVVIYNKEEVLGGGIIK